MYGTYIYISLLSAESGQNFDSIGISILREMKKVWKINHIKDIKYIYFA